MSDSMQFMVVAIIEEADAPDVVDLLLVAQDGRIWRARRSWLHGAVKPGDVLTVPLVEGRPDFSAVGLLKSDTLGEARPELVARLWSSRPVQPTVPDEEEEREAMRALIDVPSPLSIEELVKILL